MLTLPDLSGIKADGKPAKSRVDSATRDRIAQSAEEWAAAFFGDRANADKLADAEGDAEERKREFIGKTAQMRRAAIGEVRDDVKKADDHAKAVHATRLGEIAAERAAKKSAFVENELNGPDAHRAAVRNARAKAKAEAKFERAEARKLKKFMEGDQGVALPLALKLKADGLGGKIKNIGAAIRAGLNPRGNRGAAEPDLGGKLDKANGFLESILTDGIPMQPQNL